MKKSISTVHQKRLDAISCYIRELRFNEGMTQKELCQELNLLHYNTIARMESGHNMTLVSLFEIADFFGIPIGEIFADIE